MGPKELQSFPGTVHLPRTQPGHHNQQLLRVLEAGSAASGCQPGQVPVPSSGMWTMNFSRCPHMVKRGRRPFSDKVTNPIHKGSVLMT